MSEVEVFRAGIVALISAIGYLLDRRSKRIEKRSERIEIAVNGNLSTAIERIAQLTAVLDRHSLPVPPAPPALTPMPATSQGPEV